MPAMTDCEPISHDSFVAQFLSNASDARFWNLAQGGKDHFAVDRTLILSIKEIAPRFRDLAVASQGFLLRACQHLAGTAGITQFVDCGPGLPVGHRVHEIVQAINPAAKVLYVDNDPEVLAHAHSFVSANEQVRVVDGDIFTPDDMLESKEVNSFIDWSEPVAIIQAATLHHRSGSASDVARIMQTYIDAAAPGSCTVISHFLDPQDVASGALRRIEKHLLNSSFGTGWFRTLDEIRAMFPGQRLLDPGVVPCHQWPNTEIDPISWVQGCVAGGIGQKLTCTR